MCRKLNASIPNRHDAARKCEPSEVKSDCSYWQIKVYHIFVEISIKNCLLFHRSVLNVFRLHGYDIPKRFEEEYKPKHDLRRSIYRFVLSYNTKQLHPLLRYRALDA